MKTYRVNVPTVFGEGEDQVQKGIGETVELDPADSYTEQLIEGGSISEVTQTS